MNRLRRLSAVLVLACAFTVSALAGDIHCGVTDPPPPTQQEGIAETSDGMLQIATTLLEGVLALL